MKIEVVGSGSAFSKINNTSSMLVTDNVGKQWLIDCGPTIPRALFKRETGLNDIQVIYFTHVHPDHCSGLSALFNYWKSLKRTEPVTIYCQQEQQAPLQYFASFANWPSDELCFEVKWQATEDEFIWEDWEIKTAETQHQMPNRAISISIGQQKLFYSGDGRPTKATIDIMENADVAFQECASFKALDPASSHGDYPDCKALVDKANFKLLGLYHCWDEHISEIEQAVGKEDNIFLSRDGLIIQL